MRNFGFPKNSTKKIKLCSFFALSFHLTRSIAAYIANRVLEVYLPHFDGLNFVDKNFKNWFGVNLNLETPIFFTDFSWVGIFVWLKIRLPDKKQNCLVECCL